METPANQGTRQRAHAACTYCRRRKVSISSSTNKLDAQGSRPLDEMQQRTAALYELRRL